MQNPVRGALHGSGAIASLVFAIALCSRASDGGAQIVLLVCCASQFTLYLTSSLYHCAPWSPAWKRRMQRIDHSMIYAMIAGTTTPVIWLCTEEWARWAILLASWSVALLGAAQKLFLPNLNERASIAAQFLQAGLVLPVVPLFAERYPGAPLAMAVCSFSLFGAGALVFVSERPRLWPRVFSFHELFHVLVIAGSGTHYLLALRYLSREL